MAIRALISLSLAVVLGTSLVSAAETLPLSAATGPFVQKIDSLKNATGTPVTVTLTEGAWPVNSPPGFSGVYEVPSYMTVSFTPGAYLVVNENVTLTFNGPVRAPTPMMRIFEEPGQHLGPQNRRSRLRFGPNAAASLQLTPQLWGAKANQVDDDSEPLQLAIDAASSFCTAASAVLPTYCARVYLPRGNYRISSTIRVHNVLVHGAVPELASASSLYDGLTTKIFPENGITAFLLSGLASVENMAIHFQEGSTATAALQLGAPDPVVTGKMVAWNHNTLRNLDIQNAERGIFSEPVGSNSDGWGNTFDRIRIRGSSSWAIYLRWHSSVLNMRNLLIEGRGPDSSSKGIHVDGTVGINITDTEISRLNDGNALELQYDYDFAVNGLVRNLLLRENSLKSRQSALIKVKSSSTRLERITVEGLGIHDLGYITDFSPSPKLLRASLGLSALSLSGVQSKSATAKLYKLRCGNGVGEMMVDSTVAQTEVEGASDSCWSRVHFLPKGAQ